MSYYIALDAIYYINSVPGSMANKSVSFLDTVLNFSSNFSKQQYMRYYKSV